MMEKIKCLIVDDEPLALDLIEKYVRQTPFLELKGRCSNAFEAMEALNKEAIDLVFLDIQMPQLTGMELAKNISSHTKIIFTTAFEEYAIEGFKVDAVDYLLKPFSYEEFFRAATKAKSRIEGKGSSREEDPGYIFVKSEYRQIKVNLKETLYFEGLKDYVKIWVEKKDTAILSLMSLKSLEEQLPSHFLRIHRSFIINLDKIESIERGQVIIAGNRITVADQYKEKFQQFLASRSMN